MAKKSKSHANQVYCAKHKRFHNKSNKSCKFMGAAPGKKAKVKITKARVAKIVKKAVKSQKVQKAIKVAVKKAIKRK